MTASIARSELILGGQKSGKSRRAELLARQWLAESPTHRAVLIATAQPWDEEMRQRIARHLEKPGPRLVNRSKRRPLAQRLDEYVLQQFVGILGARATMAQVAVQFAGTSSPGRQQAAAGRRFRRAHTSPCWH